MRYFQGRLIDHLDLLVSDFDQSKDFYAAVLDALGRGDDVTIGRDWLGCDELYIEQAAGKIPPSYMHLCFQAADRAMVDAFYDAALSNGGRDNGPPGLRDYHPGYYAAFVLDPDGNNIEAKVDERVRARSAEAVDIDVD